MKRPLARQRPSSGRRCAGLHPRIVEEDQARGRDPGLTFSTARDVRLILFAGEHDFLEVEFLGMKRRPHEFSED